VVAVDIRARHALSSPRTQVQAEKLDGRAHNSHYCDHYALFILQVQAEKLGDEGRDFVAHVDSFGDAAPLPWSVDTAT
jgi:hypothetical protein